VIRTAGRDEAETCFEVQRAASVAGLAHVYPPEQYPYPDDEVRAQWDEKPGTVLVAERDGRIVGVVVAHACWLTNLYVIPEWWGSGVAGELHDAAVASMPDCAELKLWVLEDNSRARRFYERRGWRRNGDERVVEFPPHPIDVGYSLVREEP